LVEPSEEVKHLKPVLLSTGEVGLFLKRKTFSHSLKHIIKIFSIDFMAV
jgi:hypothetical protein